MILVSFHRYQLGGGCASKVENVQNERTRVGDPMENLSKPQCSCKGSLVNGSHLGVEGRKLACSSV